MLKVDGHQDLYRDESTNAIVNKNSVGFEQYILAKKARKSQTERLDMLENELSDIKNIMREILNKL